MTRDGTTSPSAGEDAPRTPDAALVQALTKALELQRAGRLAEAKAAYERVLRDDPRQPDALHLLGVIAYQEGRLDSAIDLMEKAAAEKGMRPAFHFQLAEAYRAAGRYDDAIAAARRALELLPTAAEALNVLGAALCAKGEAAEAVTVLRRAVEFRPNLAEPYANLGNALRAEGKNEEAAAAYGQAVRRKPDLVGAYVGLANALHALGRPDQAMASYRRALALNRRDPLVHLNLGATLASLGRTEEAVASFRQAVRLRPDLAVAHMNLGTALIAEGRLDEGAATYAAALKVRRPSPWRERRKGAAAKAGPGTAAGDRFTTEDKLRHDIEQFRYLVGQGILPASFEDEIAAYEAVLAEVRATQGGERVVALTLEQQSRVGETYNRAVHVAEAPVRKPGPLNLELNVEAIADDYHRDAPEITFFDNFLTPEALNALRRFCLESTIWYDFSHEGGYLGASMSEGFCCGLLLQIAGDLRSTFPGIFADHRLREMRADKYDSRMRGIPSYADAAAVNVNLWITPEEARLDPESGGLVVYKRAAPLEWDLAKSTKDQERVRAFLAGSDSLTIPYRQNRATIFNASLFSEVRALRFKEGYENRPIGVTMLFGVRDGRAGRQPRA